MKEIFQMMLIPIFIKKDKLWRQQQHVMFIDTCQLYKNRVIRKTGCGISNQVVVNKSGCSTLEDALPFYAPNFKAVVAGRASAGPLFWPTMTRISASAVLTCESIKVLTEAVLTCTHNLCAAFLLDYY